jgi:hypothetical protein
MHFYALKILNCAQKKYSDYSRSQYICCNENKVIDCNEHVIRRRVVVVPNNIVFVVLLLTHKTQCRTKIKIIVIKRFLLGLRPYPFQSLLKSVVKGATASA